MSSTSPPLSSVLQRPRKSPWPAIPMAEAWKILEEQVGQGLCQFRIEEQRWTNDPEILGNFLAQPIHALRPVPAFRASIKDGYAVIASDGPGPRRVVANSTAGAANTNGCLKSGECVRISTGARVPEGADAVVQVEDTELLEHDGNEELLVGIGSTPRSGQDIRPVGSDVAEGQLLLDRGARLGPAECGLLALSGRKELRIFRRPKVCVLSTGDELVDPLANWGEEIGGDEQSNAVVDTNRPALLALVRAEGFVPLDCGIARDSRETLAEAIRKAFERADVLVVTGGVSMGEKDLLKHILLHHFHLNIQFGRVFMKPGLPSTFASGQGPDGRPKLVFGLPGNPVSALVTAHLFLLPQLRRIAGAEKHWESARIAVRLSHPIRPLDTRPEYRRAVLLRPESVQKPPTAPPLAQCVTGSQISSRLLSVRSANLLLELPGKEEGREALEEGEVLTALIIGQL